MTVSDVLGRLEKVKPNGSGWMARCPAHEDRTPSLAISEGSDGRVLLKCFAGCSPNAITAAIGLQTKDLFADDPLPPRRGLTVAELATLKRLPERFLRELGLTDSADHYGRNAVVIPYRDRDGEVAGRKTRTGDRWFWEKGRPPMPYGLDRLAALSEDRSVLLVEGESDCWTAWHHGIDGVLGIPGSNAWKSEWAALLSGRDVYVWQEPDAGGKAFVEKIHNDVPNLKVIRPPETIKDLNDLHAQHPGELRERLQELVSSAVPVGTDRPASHTETGFPPFVPASEVGEVEPAGFLVDSIILEAETGFIAGDGGVFKTTAALTIAGAVAGGYRAFDRFETKQSPVAIVSEEDGADVIRNRLEALARGHGWDAARVLPNVHILAREGVTLEDEGWQAHIRGTLERTGARLLVLDPYRDLTNAGENSNDDHRPNVRFWRSLNRDGVTVLIIHHAGKAFEGQRPLDRSLRGASALNAAARFIHLLERIELGVSVRCLKMSRAAPFDPFVVEPIIETEPGKPTVWRSAKLKYIGRQEAEEQRADRLLLETLERYGRVNSSGLKDAAKGSGVSAVEMSEAIKRNRALGKINFEPGPRSSKMWGLATLPNESRQGVENTRKSLPKESRQPRQPTLPTLPEGCRARSGESALGCLPSIKEGRHPAAPPRQPDAAPEMDVVADLGRALGAG